MSINTLLAIGKKLKNKLLQWFMRHYYCCDIPIETNIASDVIFQHSGLGVVISKYAVVESGVTIMHGVTLGASNGLTNAPIIRKHSIIGAGAILVGKIEVGEGCIIDAGAVLQKMFHPIILL